MIFVSEVGNLFFKITNNIQSILEAVKGIIEVFKDIKSLYYKAVGVLKWIKEKINPNQSLDENNIDDLINSAIVLENGWGIEPDKNAAFKLYQKAADKDPVDSMRNLGICYANGHGVETNYSKAVECYKIAANHNDSEAMYCLGLAYEHGLYGDNVEPDMIEASVWYLKAAEENHIHCQGLCYANGWGNYELNHAKAAEHYIVSAYNGYADSMYCIGICYECGYGVKENEIEAKRWYTNAYKNGAKYAKEKISYLENNNK